MVGAVCSCYIAIFFLRYDRVNIKYVLYIISADGNYCLTCGSDKSVKLWNPHKSVQLKVRLKFDA